VRHLIYPVPDAKFPFLGVHFTRSVLGGIEAGPNAVLALARQGYKRTTVNVRDLVESLSFPGLWRFTGTHSAMCWSELRQSFSRDLFCRALQRLVPEIHRRDLVPSGAGVRAQAMFRNGQLVNDFLFASRPGALHILNAPSPGATASLAIGDEIVRLVGSSTLAVVRSAAVPVVSDGAKGLGQNQ
jgi:L-2-hydroxyglutarate oxidase LhgO